MEGMRLQNNPFDAVPVDRTEINQSVLNIERKTRSNFFPWNGQFSPQLVEALLQTYACHNSVILDPFAGSGTVLFESARKSLQVTAGEINPAAYCMARTYEFVNIPPLEREACIRRVHEAVGEARVNCLPLFHTEQSKNQAKEVLAKLAGEITDLRGRQLFEALVVLVDLYMAAGSETVVSAWRKLRSIVEGLPYSVNRVRALNCDARELPLAKQSVDLVITSPPYINVFNYHQNYRASAEFLGWNLLRVAKSEIGSNRKHRANRFLTVIQYCLDMYQALSELGRICRQGARVIFVVGRESMVRGVPFYNGEIVALVATRCLGFHLNARQERVFKNRFGELIYEDILHFAPGSRGQDLKAEGPSTVACELLEQALSRSQDTVRPDIRDAIERIRQVLPSPIYKASDSRMVMTAGV